MERVSSFRVFLKSLKFATQAFLSILLAGFHQMSDEVLVGLHQVSNEVAASNTVAPETSCFPRSIAQSRISSTSPYRLSTQSIDLDVPPGRFISLSQKD